MKRRFARRMALAAGVIVGVCCIVGPVRGQERPEKEKDKPQVKYTTARPIPSVEGAANFKQYCAVCHGVDAKGTGPAARALKTPPPDLTMLTKKHNGQFPEEDLRSLILGERELESHGSREMPIWGPVFRSFATSLDDQSYKLRVRNLVDYLKSIQAK